MKLNRKLRNILSASLLVGGALAAGVAQAGPDAITIGVLNDLSGPYSALAGKGSVLAAQLAVQDFGGTVLGKPVRILSADHQNKPDVGVSIVREWFDTKDVDAVFDVPNSAVALAVAELARSRGKIVAYSGPSTATITGKACGETLSQWSYDTYSQSNSIIKLLAKQGTDSWFVVGLDSEGGRAFENIGTRTINGVGGRVLGVVRHPVNNADFSSFLLQAQQSHAKAIILANAGEDTVNAIKQAHEFGLQDSGMQIVGLIFTVTDVHSLGLASAGGAVISEGFYWDLNDETRAWSRRFMDQQHAAPNMIQAGVYSAVLHYLKAMQKAGIEDGRAVAAAMKELPVNDFYNKNVAIRGDGRVMTDFYVFQVKTPDQSKGAWDYYRLIGKVAGKDVFRPAEESDCALLKK